MLDISLGSALLAGLLSFISPCVLPIVPPYFAWMAGVSFDDLRDGKTEILIFSPDFAPDMTGAAALQQKANAMYAKERRRLYMVSLEDGGTTMNAHEAFLRNLNLIVNNNDLPQLPMILSRALTDFNDLYSHYNQALGTATI